MSASPLYTRIGLDRDSDIALEKRLGTLAVALADGGDPKMDKHHRPIFRHQVVLAYYLLEERKKAREHAMALVQEAEDYLSGDWRESYIDTRWVENSEHPDGGYRENFKLGRDGCRRELQWMEVFRDGLLWALYLDDLTTARRIAEYPCDDVPEQEFDFGPPDKAWRAVAASLLLGRHRSEWEMQARTIERARAKMPRLLMGALDAASRGDSNQFGKMIRYSIRHHVRNKSNDHDLSNKLALNTSVVMQVGRTLGVSAQLTSFEFDNVVTPYRE